VPLPANTMAMTRPITNTTTIASSNPTALDVIRPSKRVEAITSAASTSNTANVISRAGFRQTRLPTGITCSRDPRAVGNLVLTSGRNTVIALR